MSRRALDEAEPDKDFWPQVEGLEGDQQGQKMSIFLSFDMKIS